MILVQNLRLQLNGSRILLLLFAGILIQSCGTSKKASRNNSGIPPTKSKPDVIVAKPKVDTVVWKNEQPKKDKIPTNTNEEPAKPKPNTTIKKYVKEDSVFRIVSLLPLKSDEVDTTVSKIPSANIRFIHFYAGMKMAVEEVNYESGRKVILDVFDTKSNDVSISLLQKYDRTPPHLIIGPYKTDALKYATDWAKNHETTLISPWVSSSSITEKNPYYVQIKAGLTAQYKMLNQHARNHYNVDNIILVSKSEDDSKYRYFNDTVQEAQKIEEKIIKEEDLASTQTNVLTPYFKTEGTTVFILPLASIKDENYIYHFLRRVSLEKGTKDVVVYGMHKWLELKPEITEYLNIQKIRLSISNYVDSDNSEVRSFKKKYYNKYREFPSEEALEGYDLMKYCIRSIRNYGVDFQNTNSSIISPGLQSSFQLMPISKDKTKNQIDFYENAFIKIIEVRNNKYRIVD